MSRQATFGRWFLSFLIMSMLAATEAVRGQASARGSPAVPDSLVRFLRGYLGPPDTQDTLDMNTRISSATVRRADGGIEQIVVYVQGNTWCGTGGCLLLVLEPAGSSYKVIGETLVVRPPIRLLGTTTKGHHDLAVWVEGGKTLPGYEALLQFDGKGYPGSASTPPARRINQRTPGKVLISSKDRGQVLFKLTERHRASTTGAF